MIPCTDSALMHAAPEKVVSGASRSTNPSERGVNPKSVPLRSAGICIPPGRTLDPQDPHLELALMREEVQVLVGLRNRLVHPVLTDLPRHREAACALAI
ncbi:MAG: hypothetical protein ACP5P4_14650, partial [Steroidobacteraceae bacterium]